MINHTCNLCHHKEFTDYLLLNHMPVTHRIVRTVPEKESYHPFRMVTCNHCNLLQLAEPMTAEELYFDVDSYITNYHTPRHLDDLIGSAISFRDPGLVIEVGCNDGKLLSFLKASGYENPIGLEPNVHAVKKAREQGFKVHDGFLTAETADKLVEKYGHFDSVFLRHVAEHVSDLQGFILNLRRLLKDGGQFVIELPHNEPGLSLGNPAILFEEHVSYMTEAHAEKMLECCGFEIEAKRIYLFSGGSLAYIAKKVSLPENLDFSSMKSFTDESIKDFPGKFSELKGHLHDLIGQAKSKGYAITLYGSATRACSVINSCEVHNKIDYCIDDRTEIHDLIFPGTRIPISSRAEVINKAKKAGKMICLLGVGADKEFIVKRKMNAEWRGKILYVSLLPHRNMPEGIRQALESL